MRSLLKLILIVAVLVAALGAFLYFTTPAEPAGVKFPLPAGQRALLDRVPATADAFALVPTAGALQRRLLTNPVLRDSVDQWTESQPIPSPWILGDADVVAWREGKATGYAIRVDRFRAFLVRTWLLWSSDADARWDGQAFVINGTGAPPAHARDVEETLEIAAGLPPGDLLAVQRNRSRGAFPPIGRPAVSTVKVTPAEILIVSRARKSGATPQAPAVSETGTSAQTAPPRFPRGAMIAATFHEPPRLVGDLQRLTAIDVDGLLAGGGSLIIYDVDAGTFLPRPKGLVSLPADENRRAQLSRVTNIAELVGQTRDTGQELLVSFDRSSLDMYSKDAFVPGAWPSTGWAVRIDPGKLVPVLEKLGDSTGLRLASGRLHRAARDLRRWIGALENAGSIEAALSTAEGTDELRVRIASK